jgi:hypothetical protein
MFNASVTWSLDLLHQDLQTTIGLDPSDNQETIAELPGESLCVKPDLKLGSLSIGQAVQVGWILRVVEGPSARSSLISISLNNEENFLHPCLTSGLFEVSVIGQRRCQDDFALLFTRRARAAACAQQRRLEHLQSFDFNIRPGRCTEAS